MPPAASLQGSTVTEQVEKDEFVKKPSLEDNASLQEVEEEERPFPWNAFSDRTYFIAGVVILFFIIIPTMSIIILSNVLGFALLWSLYEHNPVGKAILETLRGIQRSFFQAVANVIMLDPRDASYLPWMVWGTFIQPAAFLWAYNRYQQYGLELSTFVIYHLLRVGPRHQMFAHHATLVHKEGHAYRQGLYRNLFVRGDKRVPYSKFARRCCFDHVNAGIAGLLYGTIPNHYATAHNKIHHRWHNDTGDVHTNMDFDRTSFKSYILYLPRFLAYWTGVSPAILFWSRGEYKFLRELAYGMIYYYNIGFCVWYKCGFVFYWAYILYPMLEGASFLGMIAYLWHMFSEESDPTNQYINSITIVRGGNNVWNEDFHVVHHHEPNVHWTDMPQSFYQNIDNYVACRATVFGDCEQGMLINWIFGQQWDTLTDHFVDLQYKFPNGDFNKDKLYTMKMLKSVETNENEYRKHHTEIKEMLLRRLRYHYRGNRKDESRNYNARLSENIRDFDKISGEKQS